MTPQHDDTDPPGANTTSAGFREVLSNMDNAELLSALDLARLELERRLYRYRPPEPSAPGDGRRETGLGGEGQSEAGAGPLFGPARREAPAGGGGRIGPESTRPSWNADPRLSEEHWHSS